jgi:GTPase SAR1 family protein/gas vesicle protein
MDQTTTALLRDTTAEFMQTLRSQAARRIHCRTRSLDSAATFCTEYFHRLETWSYCGTSRGSGSWSQTNGALVRPPAIEEGTVFGSPAARVGGGDDLEDVDAVVEDEIARAKLIVRQSTDLPAKTRNHLTGALGEMDNRLRDHRLFLGIVGEFSSGKSTLINALSRNPYLATSVLPATTQAPTVIAAGLRDDAEVFRTDGQYLTFLHDGLGIDGLLSIWLQKDATVQHGRAALREFVMSHSADERLDGDVQQVNVFCTDPGFHQGFAIVDTPGINAEGKIAHVELTRRAMRELCDAVVVVAPANAPLSSTLMSFIRQELLPVAHRLVFVLTKIDLVRERERDAVVRHTRAVLTRELGLDDPVVLPLSALVFMDTLSGDSRDESDPLASAFLETEGTILAFLRANRRLILLENLLSLLAAFHDDLQAALRRLGSNYRKQHKQIVEARIPDLNSCVANWTSEYCAKVREAVASPTKRFGREVSEARRKPVMQIRRDASAATTKKKLQAVLSSASDSAVRNGASAVDDACKELIAAVSAACEQVHEEFFEEFENVYARLAPCTQEAVPALGRDSSMRERLAELRSSKTPPVLGKLSSAIKKDGYFQAGGAIAGATLGAVVAGPIGFFVGGFLGSKVRNVFGPSLDELRSEGLRQIEPLIEQQMDAIEDRAQGFGERVARDAEKAVDEMVAVYIGVYEKLVEQVIEEDERKNAELTVKQEDTARVLKRLSGSRKRLKELADRLRCQRNVGYA